MHLKLQNPALAGALFEVLPQPKRQITKTFWLAMKLTAVILLAACLQVSAAGFSQQITLSEKNVPLEKIFSEIRKQTGYEFFYSTSMMESAKKVTINIKHASIKDVLDVCFNEQPLNYTIYEKTIIVKAKPQVTIPALPGNPWPFAPPIDISGRVVDDKGEVVAGATVSVKGEQRSVSTDANGVFTIKQVDENATLVISGINIETYEIKVNGKKDISIVVNTTVKELNQTVVVGFGTQKKMNLTGAITQIDGKVLDDRPVTNLGQALQGIIPNLNITTGGDPGGPGTDATYNIRGTTTLSGAGNPLFIVDGVPVDQPNDLNPNDIASVTVLKDASASAIYGARAPYGVILITTKRGKKGEKAVVSYNTMFAQSSYTRLPKMANSLEFAEAFNIASQNSGQGSPFSDETIEKIKANIAKPGSYPVSVPDPNNPSRWTYADPTNTDNVDWFRTYFKPWSYSQKHDLSLSGGNQTTTYYMGIGFLDQQGQLRYGNEKFNRYNLSGNIHTEPTKWLRFDLRTRFAKRETNIPFEYANQMGNWIHMATTRHPNWALRDPNDKFSIAGNVDFMANGGRRKKSEDDLTLIGSAEIEPVKNWKINFDYSYNNQAGRNAYNNAYVWSYGPQGNKFNIGPAINSVGEEMRTDNYQSLNLYSTYERNFGRHGLKVMAGHQRELYNGKTIGGERPDLITDMIPSFGTATGIPVVYESIPNWATMGTFGRINYNYDEKYLLQADGRYDGSSKFPSYNRFGFFPTVSVGYVLSKENYWDGLSKYINYFKVRASYGTLGNQNVEDYLYLALVPVNNNIPYILNGARVNSLGTPKIISPDITWESARSFDIGAEATFLNNRLQVEYDWYTRTTLDMFGPASVLPATLGAAVPFQNNADLQTKGFELSIHWRDRIGTDLSYNASLVLSDYTSTIRQYYNPQKLLPLDTRNNRIYYTGMKMGEIWGMETKGIIQSDQDIATMADQSAFYGVWTQGDVMYNDLNGDKKIDWGDVTLDDHGDLKVIGNSTPRFSFGLNLGLNWKGFDFTMFWQGVAKRDAWLGGDGWGNDGNLFWGFVPGFGNNVYKATLDFWTPENRSAYYPKPYLSSEIVKNHRPQTRYLQNAAYARLKNLQVGYDLAPIIKKIGIEKLRLFISAENLLLITKLQKNYDPELLGGGWGTGKVFPLLKTIAIGANVSF